MAHSDYIYLQPREAGEAHRILVKRKEFDITPHVTFFSKTFYSAPPQPPFTYVDGIPVYFVPVPHAVLLELVRCATNPVYTERATRFVPASLSLDRASWLEYLHEYALIAVDDSALPDGPQKKKLRADVPLWFPTAKEMSEVSTGASPVCFYINSPDLLTEAEFAYMLNKLNHSAAMERGSIDIDDETLARVDKRLHEIGYTVSECAPRVNGKTMFRVEWKR